MVAIKTNLNNVSKCFPSAVKEIEKKIRKGRSKHKNDTLSSFDWYYDWCVMVKGNSIDDIISGEAFNQHNKWEAMSVDEKVKDELSRSSVNVVAKKGRGAWTSDCVSPIPQEIEDMIRHGHQKNEDEKKRFNSLPQSKRDEEMNEVLKKLSKHSGFFAVEIKK